MAGYRDLKVWQLAVELSLLVYRSTHSFPREEIYGLTSQLRCAAVSVPSNIAEGHARKSQKDFLRFLNISKGSLAEIETQLIIAKELNYLDDEQCKKLLEAADRVSRMLSGLINSVNKT